MIYIETLAQALDEMQAKLAAVEQELAEWVASRKPEHGKPLSRELWSRAALAAKLEGQIAVLAQAAKLEALIGLRNLEPSVVWAAIRKDVEGMLLSPDDTWSGRGNDLRRCFGDGVRDAARDVLAHIRYEETRAEREAASPVPAEDVEVN